MSGRGKRKPGEAKTRRLFLRDGLITGGLAVGAVAGGGWLYSDTPMPVRQAKVATLPDYRVAVSAHYPVLSVVRGQDVWAMASESVARLGGMGRFVQKGESVLLKPNVGWDRFPEQAANTRPELVGALVRLCQQAGAAQVYVSDLSLNDPQRCFFRSGIEKAAQEAGAKVLIPGRDGFIQTDMGGEVLGVWPVLEVMHRVQRVINLPIVKHHSLSHCTLSMKNHYGVIGGRRNRLHQNIHTSIVDLAAAVKPTLTVMDATRVLMRNGPTGGNLADVSQQNTLLAATDEVALDSYALSFLNLTPEQVPYLGMAQQRGLGKVDWKGLNWVERQVG
ncbi:protein of unknown function DUF362 [Magnetococcus marinus MC-1]|uniref:DUF362 domain-containing protein n=1 Tax=Magnetococcus marinus (strain ATCC BAA-1437 / JCM 17883 / MC-1) TaxID=156889 RepID=A0L9G6_MAGMM|nr:DUF362 domain-containing protein [Magnetococcus marinus]ABK44609.1 protein of unknown function DUF362 [Magnetococcus marinus MC-1]